MYPIREIKEEPCLKGTLNEEYQVPEIDIKEESYYLGGSLNEMKIELEEPQVPHMNLQDETNIEIGCDSDNLMLNGYKIATKTEIKEEHLWEGRTSEDVKCWTILSLDSEPLSQKGIKDTASCISKIENNPNEQPVRLPDGGHETPSFSWNGHSLLTSDVGDKYETQSVHEVGETFFHEINCNQKSTEESNSVIQDNTKPLKCLICAKSFKYSYYLKRHMLVHTGEKPYPCEICKKRFTQKGQLKTHSLLHSGTKPHKCEFCNMSYTQLGNLKKHLSTHSGLKPYKCDMCEKGYVSRSDLSRHMLTHSGVKPFKCDICQKRFTDSSVLTRHKLIHSIIHKCDVCQKTFSRRSALSKHKYAFSHT